MPLVSPLYRQTIYKNFFVCAGDPLDALILGNPLPYGYEGKVKVRGVMKFIDAGLVDDKLICTQLIPGILHRSYELSIS